MASSTGDPDGGLVKADLVIRAKTIYTLWPSQPTQKALATLNGRILAISEDSNGLDALVGPKTQVIDQPDSVVLPSFDDTHTHLNIAGASAFNVPVHKASNLAEMLKMIGDRAASVPEGEWIATTTNFQEYNLPEKRLPTLKELDEVAPNNPVVVQRGGHNMVGNSLAMSKASITPSTQPPQGGNIGHNADGSLNGALQDSAVDLLLKAIPSSPLEKRIEGLSKASSDYAATGTGCVRDCWIPFNDLPVLQAAHDAGKLHVRVRALVSTIGMSSAAEVRDLLAGLEDWRGLQHGPHLSIWGLKFMTDGGIETGATLEPYAKSPYEDNNNNNDDDGDCCATQFRGSLMWTSDALFSAMDLAVRAGWRIGTHAYGDRAVSQLLDVYARVLAAHPYLPRGTLVMEHGGLATRAMQRRAVALGIGTTIQQPLIYEAAGIQAVYWGEERVARAFPAREWLDAGALIAGGSDYPVGRFEGMRSVWGMCSRETVRGVMGPEQRIGVEEACQLHTTKAVELLREEDVRGALVPGRYADVCVWPVDPFRADVSGLRDLLPLYTIVGGKIVHSAL